MAKYTPHTENDVSEMLSVLGKENIDELFEDVPGNIRLKSLNMDGGLSQFSVMEYMKKLAGMNKRFYVVLRGAGAYDHYIPPVVTSLVSRGEFLTAYTPYQAEISQGVLQSIFEYQTLMCRLTGMDVSNASVYDGASAAAEAMTMCCDKKKKVMLLGAINPMYIETIKTYAHASGIEVECVGDKEGLIDFEKAGQKIDETYAAVFSQSPNYYGLIEDSERVAALAGSVKARFVYIFNPVAAMLLKTPAESGADIAVGEGQPLGIPMNFGGPYLGIMTCKNEMIRRLPGRIVGETTDHEGRRAYVLTMQAREQHIRREKATSSVCSNEALCALTATIYLSAMGSEFKNVAKQCATKAHYLLKGLENTGRFRRVYKGEFFHEFVTESDASPDDINAALQAEGILGGLKTEDGKMLWCVTEKPAVKELDKVIAIAGGVR